LFVWSVNQGKNKSVSKSVAKAPVKNIKAIAALSFDVGAADRGRTGLNYLFQHICVKLRSFYNNGLQLLQL